MRREQNESAIDDWFCGNYVVDEGRPLGVVLQEKAPNHLPLLQPKAVVVSRKAKRPGSIWGQVAPRKRNDREPPLLMSKRARRYRNRGLSEDCGISSDGTCLRAERYPAYRWPDPGRGDYMERGNLRCRCKRRSRKWIEPQGREYGCDTKGRSTPYER